ncbi:hypothetical protein G3580_04970 [Nitrogeniibacter mangrovi]|uniref:Uncharacterized protein n=1 Tax=Nitrogeniibacter mangrovi TaxID=2016596 RepID=A0A6C1B0B1_9RHOO|nr:hypothetical protein [Nitrogeniibacter mangrovi]QID17046.1 hypothetical protein G3580_04970 [Nitrogeniibacter mangrovi]
MKARAPEIPLKEFAGGHDDFAQAARVAAACDAFRADDEGEWVADEPRSCYNCRARRWTRDAFVCLKGRL